MHVGDRATHNRRYSRDLCYPVRWMIPQDSTKAAQNKRTNASIKKTLSGPVKLVSLHALLATIFLRFEYQSVNLNDVAAANRYAENSSSPAWWKTSKNRTNLRKRGGAAAMTSKDQVPRTTANRTVNPQKAVYPIGTYFFRDSLDCCASRLAPMMRKVGIRLYPNIWSVQVHRSEENSNALMMGCLPRKTPSGNR